MSDLNACPICDAEALHEISFNERRKVGRRAVEIIGLIKTECAACGSDFVSATQHDANTSLIANYIARTQTGITRGILRKLRETWGLSQRDASKIFGAGDTAFAKWESGKELSTPAALLIQVATNVRGAMPYLAKLANIVVDPAGNDRADYILEGTYDWTATETVRACEPTVSKAVKDAFVRKDDLSFFTHSPKRNNIPDREWEDYCVSLTAENDENFALAA